MKGYKTEITEDLINNVIVAYKKGITATSMATLGICPALIASKILKDKGLTRKKETVLQQTWSTIKN